MKLSNKKSPGEMQFIFIKDQCYKTDSHLYVLKVIFHPELMLSSCAVLFPFFQILCKLDHSSLFPPSQK